VIAVPRIDRAAVGQDRVSHGVGSLRPSFSHANPIVASMLAEMLHLAD